MSQAGPVLPRSQVSVKTVLTVLVTVLAGAALIYVIFRARVALSMLLAAGLVSVALNHGVDRLRAWKVGRRSAIAAVCLAFLAAIAAIGLVLIPPAVRQVEELVQNVPELVGRARGSALYQELDRRLDLDARIAGLQSRAPSYLQAGANTLLGAARRLLSWVGAAVTLFFLVVFMLAFGQGLVDRLLDEALPLRRPIYERVLRRIYRSLGGYLGGLAFVCFVNAVFSTAWLALIRVPFFLPLGIASGLSSLIPLLGNTLAGVIISLIAFAAGGLWEGIATAAFYILYQQFENQLLGPLVYRRTVKVNPLVVVMALIVLTDLLGIMGAIFSVPVVAVAQIVLRELLALRRERLGLPADGPANARRAPA